MFGGRKVSVVSVRSAYKLLLMERMLDISHLHIVVNWGSLVEVENATCSEVFSLANVQRLFTY